MGPINKENICSTTKGSATTATAGGIKKPGNGSKGSSKQTTLLSFVKKTPKASSPLNPIQLPATLTNDNKITNIKDCSEKKDKKLDCQPLLVGEAPKPTSTTVTIQEPTKSPAQQRVSLLDKLGMTSSTEKMIKPLILREFQETTSTVPDSKLTMEQSLNMLMVVDILSTFRSDFPANEILTLGDLEAAIYHCDQYYSELLKTYNSLITFLHPKWVSRTLTETQVLLARYLDLVRSKKPDAASIYDSFVNMDFPEIPLRHHAAALKLLADDAIESAQLKEQMDQGYDHIERLKSKQRALARDNTALKHKIKVMEPELIAEDRNLCDLEARLTHRGLEVELPEPMDESSSEPALDSVTSIDVQPAIRHPQATQRLLVLETERQRRETEKEIRAERQKILESRNRMIAQVHDMEKQIQRNEATIAELHKEELLATKVQCRGCGPRFLGYDRHGRMYWWIELGKSEDDTKSSGLLSFTNDFSAIAIDGMDGISDISRSSENEACKIWYYIPRDNVNEYIQLLNDKDAHEKLLRFRLNEVATNSNGESGRSSLNWCQHFEDWVERQTPTVSLDPDSENNTQPFRQFMAAEVMDLLRRLARLCKSTASPIFDKHLSKFTLDGATAIAVSIISTSTTLPTEGEDLSTAGQRLGANLKECSSWPGFCVELGQAIRAVEKKLKQHAPVRIRANNCNTTSAGQWDDDDDSPSKFKKGRVVDLVNLQEFACSLQFEPDHKGSDSSRRVTRSAKPNKKKAAVKQQVSARQERALERKKRQERQMRKTRTKAPEVGRSSIFSDKGPVTNWKRKAEVEESKSESESSSSDEDDSEEYQDDGDKVDDNDVAEEEEEEEEEESSSGVVVEVGGASSPHWLGGESDMEEEPTVAVPPRKTRSSARTSSSGTSATNSSLSQTHSEPKKKRRRVIVDSSP